MVTTALLLYGDRIVTRLAVVATYPPSCMLTRVCLQVSTASLVLSTTCCLSMSILIAEPRGEESNVPSLLLLSREHALSEKCALQNALL